MTEGASNLLSNLSVKNLNTLIIGNLDINLISSKLDELNLFAQRRVDTIIVTETKLDWTFPISQFMMDCYTEQYCFNRNRDEGWRFIFGKTFQGKYWRIINYHTTMREFLLN